MAAENHLHIRTLAAPTSDDDATDTEEANLVQRGESWLLTHIQHTAGIYGFFALLAECAYKHTEQELC